MTASRAGEWLARHGRARQELASTKNICRQAAPGSGFASERTHDAWPTRGVDAGRRARREAAVTLHERSLLTVTDLSAGGFLHLVEVGSQ